MLWNFEVIFGKCTVVRISTSGNYATKLFTKLGNCSLYFHLTI